MTEKRSDSVPMNQTLKLPGGTTITRMEAANLLRAKGISLGLELTNPGELNSTDCGSACPVHCNLKCDVFDMLFNGLSTAELYALIKGEIVSLSHLNVEQLQAIRPMVQPMIAQNNALAAKLSPDQLKAIKG